MLIQPPIRIISGLALLLAACGPSATNAPTSPPVVASAATTAPLTIAVSAPAAPTGVYLKGPGPNWLGLAMFGVPASNFSGSGAQVE